MSDTPIDKLLIEIAAKSSKADAMIDGFAKAIGNVASSLASVDTGKLNGVGNSIQGLGLSLQSMKTVDARSINSVVNKINSLSAIDTSQFATVSANLYQMANGIQSLGMVSANVASVGELASNISKLGNKSVQNAVTNIPLLATALDGLMNTLSHTPKVSQNVIDMTNALANLSAQGSKVGNASNSIEKGLDKTSTSATRANKSFKGLASVFGRFYANCFMVIRGVKSLWKSIEGTADYLEAFNYFEVALNKVGSDWSSDYEKYGYENAEAYANSFKTRLNESLSGLSGVQISVDANGKTGILSDTGMKNLGLNIQEVTQYASQLASVTNSVGQTGEVTLATASAFTKLGADISSLFNMDYSTVMNNLQSGLIGQSRALYKYGVDITNATLQTYAYGLGVEKAVSEMTQAEKMQLRIIAILDQSRVSWGDQANTINSLSNSIRQFKNNIKEAGMILGQLFIPILSKVMSVVNGLTIAIKRLMVSVANIFGIKLDLSEFGQSADEVEDNLGGISDGLDSVAKGAEKAKAGIRGFDELNVINSNSGGGSGDTGVGGTGGLDLTQQILDATSAYEKAWQEAYDRMQNKAEGFANSITKSLEPVKKIFEDIAIGDWIAVGKDTSNLVVSIFDFFSKAIDEVDWYKIGRKIGDVLVGIEWFKVLKSAGKLMWQGLKAAFELAIGVFDSAPLETAVLALVAMPGLLKAVTHSKFVTGFKKLSKMVNLTKDAFVGNTKAIKTLNKIFPGFGKMVDTLGDSFQRLMFGISADDWAGGISAAITNIRDNLSLLQTTAIVSAAGFVEFRLIKIAFEDLALGCGNVVTNISKIGVAAGIAASAMYVALGPAGLAVAGIVGLTAAVAGISAAEDEVIKQSQIESYGGTVEEVVQSIQNATNAIRDRARATMDYVNDAGIAEYNMAKDLIEQYYELANKENLTNEEKDTMKNLSQQLVELFPDLKQVYDEETGLITAQKDEVNKLVDAKLKEIQTQAAQEKLLELYKQKLDAEKELKVAIDDAKTAQDKVTAAQNEYTRLSGLQKRQIEYEELGRQINNLGTDTGDLIEKQKKLYNEMTNYGKKPENIYKDLTQELGEASEKLTQFKGEFETFQQNLVNPTETYTEINGYIGDLTEMLKTGMTTSGENGAEGLAKGFENNRNLVEEASKLLGDTSIKGTMGALDEHSPSKEFEKIGQYAVEGFNNGITDNQESTIKAVKAYAEEVLKTFENGLSSIGQVGRNAIENLKYGFADSSSLLYQQIDNIVDGVLRRFKEIPNYLNSLSGMSTGMSASFNFQSSIPAYATGGIVEDGLFYANHNEMIGKFSNGKTVAANNDQIVGGIQQGVHEAFSADMSEYSYQMRQLRESIDEQNKILSEMNEKGLVFDDSTFTRKYQTAASKYRKQTGKQLGVAF